MFSPVPLKKPPNDGSELARYVKHSHDQLEAINRFQGERIQGGSLPCETPAPQEFVYGIIRDESGAGSGGSGSGVAGFLDPEGFLCYAFDEVFPHFPWRGLYAPGGVHTIMPVSLSDWGSNYAYPLNEESIDAGTKVLLRRAGHHWAIVGGAGTPGGSGHGCQNYTVICPDGTHQTITVCPAGSTPGGGGGTGSGSGSGGHGIILDPPGGGDFFDPGMDV